jgi:hypothetical protein
MAVGRNAVKQEISPESWRLGLHMARAVLRGVSGGRYLETYLRGYLPDTPPYPPDTPQIPQGA